MGERALLKNEPRTATIKVASETATAVTLARDALDIVLGRWENNCGTSSRRRFGNIRFDDLKTLGLLGCGGFGTVDLVEDVTTNLTYALKALSKGYVVKVGMQSNTMAEKNLQLMCDSPFVVKLYETYNTEQNLYFLLELALGGDLYIAYNKKRLWGKVDHARFYIAGAILAFDHLHEMHIIHRDLKPENLLLNQEGNVKLT